MSEYIFGKNALYEAITAKIPLKKVFISQNLKECKNLCSSIQKKSPGTSIELLPKKAIDAISRGARSGGICVLLDKVPVFTSLKSFLKQFTDNNISNRMFVAVDEVVDPHNFGAIIRSALGAGFDGVIFQKRRQAPITAVVASSSSGACFRIPLCEVINMSRTLTQLKEEGFWIYGSDSDSNSFLYDMSYNSPLVLVIGSEGKGMRKLIREYCDEIIAIPIKAGIDSLNASVASGIIMFEIKRKSAAL